MSLSSRMNFFWWCYKIIPHYLDNIETSRKEIVVDIFYWSLRLLRRGLKILSSDKYKGVNEKKKSCWVFQLNAPGRWWQWWHRTPWCFMNALRWGYRSWGFSSSWNSHTFINLTLYGKHRLTIKLVRYVSPWRSMHSMYIITQEIPVTPQLPIWP